ncbi:MAG: LapA family protein [Deferribacteres bacterium]|nr:LapA family protein [Deferribacteres bacterium]
MHFFLFFAFLIAVVFVIITFQNPGEISMKFIKWNFSKPFSVMLAVPFVAGTLVGIFLIIPTWWKKVKLARTQKKRIQELESELSSIKEQIEPAEPEELPAEPETHEGDRH